MSNAEQRYERGNLTIIMSRADDWTTIAWRGSSDARDPVEFLNPLFQRLTEEVRGQHVLLDFAGTEYMNSATLSPMLDLIRDFDQVSPQVIVRFSEEDWQLFFHRCVRSFARTLHHVRVDGPKMASSSLG